MYQVSRKAEILTRKPGSQFGVRFGEVIIHKESEAIWLLTVKTVERMELMTYCC